MKKLNIIKFILSGALLASTVSCYEEAEFAQSDKPVVSNVGETTFTLEEGSSATIDLAISKSIASSIFVIFRPQSGDADYSDYTLGDGILADDFGYGGPNGYVVEIPAYTSTYSIPVEAIMDIAPEGAESVTLDMLAWNTRMGIIEGGKVTYTINVSNFESDDLDITFAWNDGGTYYDTDGEEIDLCDIDFDLELYDSGFDLVAYSWSNCPEDIYIPAGALPDGTYYLGAAFYSINGVEFESTINFPAMLTFTKVGQSTTTLDLSSLWNSVDGGYDDGNDDGYYFYILTISNGGTTYSITDFQTGDTVFAARMANIKADYLTRKHKALNK